MLFHAQLALLSHLCLQLPPAINSSPMPVPALAPPLTAASPSIAFCIASGDQEMLIGSGLGQDEGATFAPSSERVISRGK